MNNLEKIEDISIDKAPEIYKAGGLDVFIEMAKREAEEVPDLSSVKGRKRIASLAAKVSSSKVAVEKVGREYLRQIKEKPREIEKELKKFVDSMNDLRDITRKPLTDWENEQERIRAEEEAKAEAERLAAQVEADHEIAILLNEKFDREKEESERLRKEAEERARIEREEQIKREAAAKAEAEKKAAEEAAQRAKEAELAAKQAVIEAEERRKREAEEAEARRVEQEKQAKILTEQAAEQARLAEIARQEAEAKREAEEQAAREANKKHIGKIRGEAKQALMAQGLTEQQAKTIVLAIHAGQIPHVKINY